jgi:predicted dehydrogenase
MSCTRRRFLATTTTCIAAATATWHGPKRLHARSKNDRPLIGCIGVGGRGTAVAKWAANYGDIVAVADVDFPRAEARKEQLASGGKAYQDYRQMLDRPDIDVILQATPDHWHTKVNIDALLAGKDVYGEKPLTLTIEEGKILRKVVADTGRVFQTGTQQRSEPQFQQAVELVRNGRVGKIRQIWVAVPWYSTRGGPFEEQPVPEGLDWDLYQGQAPVHPYNPHRTHKTFRWWYEYAGGIITDWGNHHMDIAHWMLDADHTGPTSVEARGIFPNEGRAHCYNTPDRFFSRLEFPGGVEVLFLAALNDQRIYGDVQPGRETPIEKLRWMFDIGQDVPEELRTLDRNGIMCIGEKGRVFVNRGGIYGKPAEELAEHPLPDDAWRCRRSENHMANFFQCVQTRDMPVAPAALEHRSVSSCHLTNISLRLGGRPLKWDPRKETIVDDPEANAMLARPQRAPYTLAVEAP